MKKKNGLKGWFEEYKCGCLSETTRFKKDLLGYCSQHGEDRRNIYPNMDFSLSKYIKKKVKL